MSQILDEPLEQRRDAAARGAWRHAYELLSAVDRDSLEPGDLESLAEAAWWTGRLDEAIALRERAFTAHLEAGDDARAAVVALAISADYFGKASVSVSSGWFCKAERLLEDEEETVAHGELALMQAMNAMAAGDLDEALANADFPIYADFLVTKARVAAIRKAIAAGKHIYTEKPTAESFEDALELARLAREAGIKHGVVHDKLYLPGLLKLKRLIDSGFFGRILAVRGEFGYWVFEGDWQSAHCTPRVPTPSRSGGS